MSVRAVVKLCFNFLFRCCKNHCEIYLSEYWNLTFLWTNIIFEIYQFAQGKYGNTMEKLIEKTYLLNQQKNEIHKLYNKNTRITWKHKNRNLTFLWTNNKLEFINLSNVYIYAVITSKRTWSYQYKISKRSQYSHSTAQRAGRLFSRCSMHLQNYTYTRIGT